MSEREIRLVLESSKELWWWQRLLVGRQLHGVLWQLVLEKRVLYLRHQGRRRTDKVRFKYSMATGDTSPGASRKSEPRKTRS